MKKACKQLLDLIFPKYCIFCHKEGCFLCEDCLSLIEVNNIQYCNCFKNPKRNCLICEKCNQNICAVYTILNSKQKIAKILFKKSQKFPELNIYLCYLIISQLKNISIDKNTQIIPQSKEIEGLAKELSKRLKLNNDSKNTIILSENYPFEINFNKKITIISLFREL